MLTSSLVALTQKQFPDFSEVLIIELLNELHRYVFTQVPTERMKMYSSTGTDPVLTTVAGTYEYTINTTAGFSNNAWRVTNVYQDETDYVDVITYDAVGSSTGATVIFREDPGTQNYYLRCYRFPTEITSISKQLEIPSNYHLTHIFNGIVGLIERFRSGRSDTWDEFVKVLAPDMIAKMNNVCSNRQFSNFGGY